MVLATFIPQQGRVDNAGLAAWRAANPAVSSVVRILLLDRVYASWWFLTAAALLFTNTLACTIARIPALLRQNQSHLLLDEIRINALKNNARVSAAIPSREAVSKLDSLLRGKGYRTFVEYRQDTAAVFARRGDLAQWGSLVFHGSFLLLLCGVLLLRFGSYTGNVVVTEGQSLPSPAGGFEIWLNGFKPSYEQGLTGADFAADVIVLDNNIVAKQQTVKVNQPLEYKGVKFVLTLYGFAPYFELKSASGQELFAAFVNLRVLNPGSVDYFTIPGTNTTVSASFYPDFVTQNGIPMTRSQLPVNPVLDISVDDSGKELYKGLLPVGRNVTIGDNILAFTDLRYWTGYKVTRDPGKNVIYTSFWLAVIGISLRFLITSKRIWAVVKEAPGGCIIVLGGTAPHQEALFGEEFTRFAAEINAASGKPGGESLP